MRAIILSIEDNKVAEQFVRDMAEADRTGYPFVPRGAKLDAMVARPTKGCHCTAKTKRGGRMKPLGEFSRNVKFGWFIHSVCNRPTQTIVNNFISNMICGYRDLIPGILGRQAPSESQDSDTIHAVQLQQMRG
jgi:hypothetical protein